MRQIILLTITLFLGNWATSQDYMLQMENELTRIMNETPLVGIQVSLIDQKGKSYQYSSGLSDVKAKVPMQNYSLQGIASLSKTFIGVAIMQCVERGQLDLDADINIYLPYSIHNPNHPEAIITLRQLATHTSSLDYTIPDSDKIHFYGSLEGREKRILKFDKKCRAAGAFNLATYVQSRLDINGVKYSSKHFSKSLPGIKYKYNNLGAVLAANIIERVTGLPFDEFVLSNILTPLNMKASGYHPQEMEASQLSKVYVGKEKIEAPSYDHRLFPIGGLVTNVEDMSLYMQDMLKGINGEGVLLKKESYELMLSGQFGTNKLDGLSGEEVDMGIFWVTRDNGFIGHTGGGLGESTFFFIDPSTHTGRMLFFNAKVDASKEFIQAFLQCWKAVDTATKSMLE